MPNLQGTSPVGCDEGGRSYMTLTVGKGRPKWRCRGKAESLTLGEDVRAGAPIGLRMIQSSACRMGREWIAI